MRTTTEGQALIKSFESCSLTAYRDQGGRWTLGWGRARGIGAGDTCTQDQADAWFLEDLAEFEMLVQNCVPGDTMGPNQFSAITCFTYNVGLGQKGVKDGFYVLANGEPSTIRTCILAEDYPAAAVEFPKWNHVGGMVSAGLIRRRAAEQALFLKEG